MIYLVYGDDVKKSLERLRSIVAHFLSGSGNVSLFEVDEENFSESYFNGILKTETLFAAKNLTAAKRLLNSPVSSDFISEILPLAADSGNVFIFWEEKIKDEILELFKKHKGNIHEFSGGISSRIAGEKSEKKARDKEIFRICDFLSARKKHEAWLSYQEAIFKGIPPEEIFWKVLSQIRNLLVIKKGGGKRFKPFYFNKTKKAADLFREEELAGLSSELVELYHDDFYEFSDLGIGLEKFIWKI